MNSKVSSSSFKLQFPSQLATDDINFFSNTVLPRAFETSFIKKEIAYPFSPKQYIEHLRSLRSMMQFQCNPGSLIEILVGGEEFANVSTSLWYNSFACLSFSRIVPSIFLLN